MDAKKTTRNIAPVKAASITAAIFVAAVAALFVMMPVTPLAAGDTMSIKGSVASVDSYDRIFSVLGPEGKITFGVDKSTIFTLCARNRGFEQLAAGQKVTVKYHEREGRLVADAVDTAPILLACYNQ